MYCRKLVIVIGLTIVASNNVAMGATPLEVPGFGSTRCSEIAGLQAQDTKRLEHSAWVQGALIGLMIAEARREVAEFTEVEGMPLRITYDSSGDWDWIVEYCQENENDNLAQALMGRWEAVLE